MKETGERFVVQAGELSARQELLRGWPRWLAGGLGVALGASAIYFYTQGIFIRPLQAEFGWTRAGISAAYTGFGLVLAVCSPICGWAVDRFGVRWVSGLSILGLVACFLALSRLDNNLGMFVAVGAAMGGVAAGTTAVPYVRLVGGWFSKMRGLAIGLMMVCSGITGTFLPGAMAAYIAEHGWRAGYTALALMALIPLPFILLWARKPPVAVTNAAEPRAPAAGLSFAEAVRTRRLWVMGLTFALAGAVVVGLTPHLPPMLQDAGASPARVATTMGALGLAVIAGRALSGFALDRVFAPYVASVVLLAAAGGCVGLAVLGADFGIIGAALIGLALGAEIDLAGYMSARYFGLRSYGAIFGFLYGLFSLGGAAGPIAAGMLYDSFGDYRWAFVSAACVLVAAVPLVLSLGRYPAETELSKTGS